MKKAYFWPQELKITGLARPVWVLWLEVQLTVDSSKNSSPTADVFGACVSYFSWQLRG